jgi:hypothetical protein
MNDQVQQPVEQPIDSWNVKFAALIQEARTQELFAPDVLFILQRASVEIQHNINTLLFTHEHKVNEEGEQ